MQYFLLFSLLVSQNNLPLWTWNPGVYDTDSTVAFVGVSREEHSTEEEARLYAALDARRQIVGEFEIEIDVSKVRYFVLQQEGNYKAYVLVELQRGEYERASNKVLQKVLLLHKQGLKFEEIIDLYF